MRGVNGSKEHSLDPAEDARGPEGDESLSGGANAPLPFAPAPPD